MNNIDKPKYDDLSSLLMLIRSREQYYLLSSFQSNSIILPQSFQQRNKLTSKILNLVKLHSLENDQTTLKFWISLKKVVKGWIHKLSQSNSDTFGHLKIYNSIIKAIKVNITNNHPLKKYYQIQTLLERRFDQGKRSSVEKQLSLLKNKTLDFLSGKKKKDSNMFLASLIKYKLPRKDHEQTKKKKQLKRHQKQNKRLMETTSRLNNKLFKDLDIHTSLDQYDQNKNRNMNSCIIYGDMLNRNHIIHKQISRFHSNIATKSCHSNKQKSRYNNSIVDSQNIQCFSKTMRKTQLTAKKRKIHTPQLKLPQIPNKKDHQFKRPATSKTTAREPNKNFVPMVWKMKRNMQSLRTKLLNY